MICKNVRAAAYITEEISSQFCNDDLHTKLVSLEASSVAKLIYAYGLYENFLKAAYRPLTIWRMMMYLDDLRESSMSGRVGRTWGKNPTFWRWLVRSAHMVGMLDLALESVSFTEF